MTHTKYLSSTIELWAPDRLVKYTRNARTHSQSQINQIAASIEQFDFTNPILVDTASGILAGHGRLLAALALELELVPVIVLDHLTDTEKRACILADNQLALNAGWDDKLLAEEIARLEIGYVDVLIRRWQQHTGKGATLEGDGRVFEEVAARRLPEFHPPDERGRRRL
jgi:hypothetical protein